VIASKGGASEPLDMLIPGKAGGAVAVRRTLASTICRVADPTQGARPRQLRDVSTVMRFRPAHESMINRRYYGRAPCLARQSLQQMLERKPRIYLPATCKGRHESGANHTLDAQLGAALDPSSPFRLRILNGSSCLMPHSRPSR
jgi:hypothetical protein